MQIKMAYSSRDLQPNLTGPEVSFERVDLVKLKVKVYLFNNYLKKQKKNEKAQKVPAEKTIGRLQLRIHGLNWQDDNFRIFFLMCAQVTNNF